jgi:hypothetical protein
MPPRRRGYVVLNAAALKRLEGLIQKHKLHASDLEPVNLSAAMEPFDQGYSALPHSVLALTVRWRSSQLRRQFVRVTYARRLGEPEESARRRHAQAHEFAHIIMRHRGEHFVMWDGEGEREASACEGFAKYVRSRQEMECEQVAAYLLVPLLALQIWHGENSQYIAHMLDVPVHLVETRWHIWRKFGR